MGEFKVVKYTCDGNEIDVKVDYDNKEIWLTQKNMSNLYSKNIDTIGLHIKNINLDRSVTEQYSDTEQVLKITGSDGKTYIVKHYNMDIVMKVGYKCNPSKAVDFKEWVDSLFKYDTIENNWLNEAVKSKIHNLRNEKIMFDYDLAELYGYSTRAFNQQVSNNIQKFPERYRFKITNYEYDSILRSKNLTASWGGSRTLPYAFTEQGIYMLMTVLKGDLAVKQSIM